MRSSGNEIKFNSSESMKFLNRNTSKRTPNLVEIKKQQALKRMREQLFQQRKKVLLQENQLRMVRDLRNLEKISVSAFSEFRDQLNLYNKYYTNYIGSEMRLKEVHHEDLNLSGKLQHFREVPKGRYSYKEILNYSTPVINYENDKVKAEKEEIHRYTISRDQLSVPLLQELEQKIVKKDIGLLESDWFHLARANDVGGMRFLLINYPGVLNNRDSTGQTALHWGAKRNYYDMCWELVNLKCDVFLQDYAGRTARALAEKFGNYKIAKLIQSEEDRRNRQISSKE